MATTTLTKCPGSGTEPRLTPAFGGPKRQCRACGETMTEPAPVMDDHERVVDTKVPAELRERVDAILLRKGFLGQ